MDDRQFPSSYMPPLELSAHDFRTLFESLIDAVLLYDAEQGFCYCNPAAIAMFRATAREQILHRHPIDFSAETQPGWIPSLDLIRHQIAEVLEKGQISFEWQARRLDGEIFPAYTSLIAIDINGRRVVQCVVRDHTLQKQQELETLRIRKELESANHELQVAMEQLQMIASTDQLTSAWNRRFFNRVITTERARAARTGNPLTLILVDVDHFKSINDTHGHLVGDQVLIELAMLLQESLRETDYLIRWGGEEFAILSPELDHEDAAKLTERLRLRVASHTFVKSLALTISAGIAQLKDNDILARWISRADQALYSAKRAGRNRVVTAA